LDLVPIPLRCDPDLPKGRGLAGPRHTLNGNDAIAIGERLVDDALLRWVQAIRLRGFGCDLAGNERLKPILALAHVFDVSPLVGDRCRRRVVRGRRARSFAIDRDEISATNSLVKGFRHLLGWCLAGGVFQRLLQDISLVDNRFALEAFVASVGDGRMGMAARVVRL
jgi:hypothetical protein